MKDPATPRPDDQPVPVLLWVGSIGPLGHLPASGTVTVAVIGLPGYYVFSGVAWYASLAGLVAFILTSTWLHAAGDALLREKDSHKLVWDELAGFFVAVALLPYTWQLAALAFLLERTLDIAKVPPANWIERHWPGGWGVVGDDLAAGAYTCALLHLGVYYVPGPVSASDRASHSPDRLNAAR